MSEDVLQEEIPQLIKSSIISDMFELMYLNDGVGLAAPQVISYTFASKVALFAIS